jgi:hypothetical protein
LGAVASLAPELLVRVMREAAAEAMEFMRKTSVTAVGRGTLDHLDAVIADLDRSCSIEPPAELFTIAQAYRQRAEQLVEGPPTLRDGRELYIYAALLSELLAWITHDWVIQSPPKLMRSTATSTPTRPGTTSCAHGRLTPWPPSPSTATVRAARSLRPTEASPRPRTVIRWRCGGAGQAHAARAARGM